MNTLQNNFSWPKPGATWAVCLAGSALLLSPRCGLAQTITLNNGGSTAIVDLSGSDGVNSWTVDTSAANQLDSEWFYYSINGATAQAINALGTANYTVTGNNTLNATYSNGQISIGVGFTLNGSGSGSGSASLTANYLTATSSSGVVTNINIYEYANFNLLQSFDNGISIAQANSGPPSFTPDGFNGVTQTSGGTALTEAIANPFASYAEAGTVSTVLGAIATGGNLNDTLSISPSPGVNVAWAFEWSYQDLAPDTKETLLEQQTLSITTVPEPSSIALIALGLGAAGFLRRKMS